MLNYQRVLFGTWVEPTKPVNYTSLPSLHGVFRTATLRRSLSECFAPGAAGAEEGGGIETLSPGTAVNFNLNPAKHEFGHAGI